MTKFINNGNLVFIMNNIEKTLVTSILASSLVACGGSGSNPAPVVEPPVQPPVVVEPAGLTLEEVVGKFSDNGGLNLTKDVSGNTSFTSGSDVVENDFSFSVENSNGSKVCVGYTSQDLSLIHI
mgnify:CR=1 FL=1